MNASHALMLGVVLGIVLALAIVGLIARRLDTSFRTADGAAIEDDTRALQRLVPSAAQRRRTCTGDCQQGRRCSCAATATGDVQRRAVNAALHDAPARRKRSNPEREGSAAHAAWESNYPRVWADARRAHDDAEAATAPHA